MDALAKNNIERIYKYLKRKHGSSAKITGHSTDLDTNEYNQFVSSLRARAVALYTAELGIEEEELSREGVGSSRTLDDKGKMPENIGEGRVEFVMTGLEDE